jgi:hypothetical protein
MKTASLLLCGLLLSAVAIGDASATPVRVRLTARVSDVQDPDNVLGGKIVLGQRLTGVYVYNTNTPNQSSDPFQGLYQPYAGEARVRFVSGTHVFESQPQTQGILISVSENSSFHIDSEENLPLANGTNVSSINVWFDGQGDLTASTALPAVAPDLTDDYETKAVVISGGSFGAFQVWANIEAAELVVTPTIEVLPAASDFLPQQHFEAAVLAPPGKTITSMDSHAGGVFVPLNYPGYCDVAPPNSTGRFTLLCPNAEAAVAAAGGNPIELQIQLQDGTTVTQTVEWKLIQ